MPSADWVQLPDRTVFDPRNALSYGAMQARNEEMARLYEENAKLKAENSELLRTLRRAPVDISDCEEEKEVLRAAANELRLAGKNIETNYKTQINNIQNDCAQKLAALSEDHEALIVILNNKHDEDVKTFINTLETSNETKKEENRVLREEQQSVLAQCQAEHKAAVEKINVNFQERLDASKAEYDSRVQKCNIDIIDLKAKSDKLAKQLQITNDQNKQLTSKTGCSGLTVAFSELQAENLSIKSELENLKKESESSDISLPDLLEYLFPGYTEQVQANLKQWWGGVLARIQNKTDPPNNRDNKNEQQRDFKLNVTTYITYLNGTVGKKYYSKTKVFDKCAFEVSKTILTFMDTGTTRTPQSITPDEATILQNYGKKEVKRLNQQKSQKK